MNYDFNTQHAKDTSLKIVDDGSITCKDCYAFLGAGILIQLEYFTASLTLHFEIKLAGGAGFNLNVEASNPVVSASKTRQLLAPLDKKNGGKIIIGTTGLTLFYTFGGMDATLSGSGSGTGTTSTGAGMKYAVMANVLYDGKALSAGINQSFTKTPPFFKTTGYTPSKGQDVAVTLLPQMNCQLVYGVTTTNVAVDFTITSPVTSEYTFSDKSSAAITQSLQTSSSSSDNTDEFLVTIEDDKTVFYPGENISITVTYSGLPPNEKTFLYYSFQSDNGQEFEVLQKKFVTNAVGYGSFTTNLVLAWNSWYANDNNTGSQQVTLVIHASTHILKSIIGPTISVAMFTEMDSIFTNAPINGSVVTTDTPLALEWNPKLLQYFAQTSHNIFGGSVKLTKSVMITIVGETFNQNGTIASKVKTILTNSVNNTGYTTITIPSSLVKPNTRYYLTVGSSSYSDVFGWSEGYFRLADKKSSPSALVMDTFPIVKKNLLLGHHVVQKKPVSKSTEASINHNNHYNAIAIRKLSTIVNPGFENGFTGWTQKAGTVEAVADSPNLRCYSGLGCVSLGDTGGVTKGDSILEQTFTTAANDIKLIFRYEMQCQDTAVSYARVQLIDTTDSTKSADFNLHCEMSTNWNEVSTDLQPGHTYTLRLTNHDDSSGTHACYVGFDDIQIIATAVTDSPTFSPTMHQACMDVRSVAKIGGRITAVSVTLAATFKFPIPSQDTYITLTDTSKCVPFQAAASEGGGSSSAASVGAIVGGVIGGLAFLILIAVVVFYQLKKLNKTNVRVVVVGGALES